MALTPREEALDDLLDWAKRWQAGRRKNTEDDRRGVANHALIIVQAKKMNDELDDILKAYDRAVKKENK